MNSGREEERLIQEFKEKFHKETGKWIKVTYCKLSQSHANVADRIPFWKVVKIVTDYTGWFKDEVITKSRTGEPIFRRGLIDYIAVNNGCTFTECARSTKRDHTTVINSVRTFENKLDTDMHVKSVFNEVISFIKDNYHLYKDKVINEEDID